MATPSIDAPSRMDASLAAGALHVPLPVGLKISKGSLRERLLMAGLVVFDFLLWPGIYIGISEGIGDFNRYGTAEVLIPTLISMFALTLVGGYNARSKMRSLAYSSEHVIACFAAFLVSAVAVYLVASFGGAVASSRAIFAGTFLAFGIVSLVVRRAIHASAFASRSSRRLLVISDREGGRRFYKNYLLNGQPQRLHFFAAGDAEIGEPVDGDDSPCYAALAAEVLHDLQNHVDTEHEAIVIAAPPDQLSGEILNSLVAVHFQELPVYTMHSFFEAYWQKMPPDLLSRTWPLDSGFQLVQHSAFASLKRVFDIVLSGMTLLLAGPLMAIVAVWIRMQGDGPVIFRQTRVGQHGSLFTLYKFRTMQVGSENKGLYTTEGDPRVTRFGHWLRITRIDELPQLWNVLRGEMSLIGPRAEWIKCVEQYENEIPYYHFRHLVRPGITGWAQVNYSYGASLHDTVEKLMYDLYYIRHFSLALDATVILKTLHVMIFGKGR
jgi:exopolysaccharide biosynthesis polyprenyl glycosylphosphotransferase